MRDTWTTEPFDSALGGVSSAVDPRFLNPSQLAWGKNVVVRGGFPGTRPAFRERLVLPSGIVQGAKYFSVQNGMIVVSIAGNLYRLRIGNETFSTESIPLTFRNSANLTQCWMCQTVESLIVQDGQADPIIYNGSSARRASRSGFEVPLGRQMAYGNGRLWVAINQFNVVAGDIRTQAYQSELKFTETTYLSGGGALYFSTGVNGLAFVPTVGGGDYGTLMIFGTDFAETVRADISSRDLWAQMPGFSSVAFRNIGCASQDSIVEVNQDLYWRDNEGGIRSLRSASSDEMGPGNAPISREVSRIVDYESHQYLGTSSGIYFDNRLLMTGSPYLNTQGGVSFKNLISLDFAPISTMAGKSAPVYDGAWEGIGVAQLVSGKFDGRNRAFAISSDQDGKNRLWEIMASKTSDLYLSCGDSIVAKSDSPIVSQVEYARRNFGDPRNRKRLIRCDVYVTNLSDDSDLSMYWRSDNDQKWRKWDDKEFCAKITDSSSTSPHFWKNLSTQQRPQIKTFTIPEGTDAITHWSTEVGFEFQFKLVWSGGLKIYKVQVHSEKVVDSPYADQLDATCLTEDLTGNEQFYEIPTGQNSCILNTVVACRYRSGTGALCGIPEYVNPSTPPRYYRRQQYGGSAFDCEYSRLVCDGGDAFFHGLTQASGAYQFDRLTCAVTNTQLVGRAALLHDLCTNAVLPTEFNFPYSPPPAGYPLQLPPDDGTGQDDYRTRTITRTTFLLDYDKGCIQSLVENDWRRQWTGKITSTLSDEDTEADAIARVYPNPDAGWSSYQTPASGGCCTSRQTLRGAGQVSFQFKQVEFQVTGTGGYPGSIAQVSIPVYRRLIGDTAWTLWETLVYSPTIAPDGTVSFTDFVPMLSGYEVYVQAPGTCS
jgi:hypothetical protein